MEVKSGKAKGAFALVYQDLKINKISRSGDKKKFKSKIANIVIKNNENTMVPLSYKRQDTDEFITFVWRAVSSEIEKEIVKDIFKPFIRNEK